MSEWTVRDGVVGYLAPPVREGCQPVFQPASVRVGWTSSTPSTPYVDLSVRRPNGSTCMALDPDSAGRLVRGDDFEIVVSVMFLGVRISASCLQSELDRADEQQERRQAKRREREERVRAWRIGIMRSMTDPRNAFILLRWPSRHNKLWGSVRTQRAFLASLVSKAWRGSKELAIADGGLDAAIEPLRALVLAERAERKAAWLAKHPHE